MNYVAHIIKQAVLDIAAPDEDAAERNLRMMESEGFIEFDLRINLSSVTEDALPFLPLCIHKSAAGYYIGTANEEGPVSRISGYWPDQSGAQLALDHLFAGSKP